MIYNTDSSDELIESVKEEIVLSKKSESINCYLPTGGVQSPQELDWLMRLNRLKNKPTVVYTENEAQERFNKLLENDSKEDTKPILPSSQSKKTKLPMNTPAELAKLWKDFNLDELNDEEDDNDDYVANENYCKNEKQLSMANFKKHTNNIENILEDFDDDIDEEDEVLEKILSELAM